ncbi:MAG: hypothetical protein EXS55_04670 [Candidatus Magasanikbacteria bacterium]|nr:hypothetical protein [Candidatus Magasanikbacteria bacterium]
MSDKIKKGIVNYREPGDPHAGRLERFKRQIKAEGKIGIQIPENPSLGYHIEALTEAEKKGLFKKIQKTGKLEGLQGPYQWGEPEGSIVLYSSHGKFYPLYGGRDYDQKTGELILCVKWSIKRERDDPSQKLVTDLNNKIIDFPLNTKED